MISELVIFNLPKDITRERIIADMRKTIPIWSANSELIRKSFLYDPDNYQAGALYLWKNKSAAIQAHNEVWHRTIVELYGSEPEIRFFETPLVIDNALQDVIEESVT